MSAILHRSLRLGEKALIEFYRDAHGASVTLRCAMDTEHTLSPDQVDDTVKVLTGMGREEMERLFLRQVRHHQEQFLSGRRSALPDHVRRQGPACARVSRSEVEDTVVMSLQAGSALLDQDQAMVLAWALLDPDHQRRVQLERIAREQAQLWFRLDGLEGANAAELAVEMGRLIGATDQFRIAQPAVLDPDTLQAMAELLGRAHDRPIESVQRRVRSLARILGDAGGQS